MLACNKISHNILDFDLGIFRSESQGEFSTAPFPRLLGKTAFGSYATTCIYKRWEGPLHVTWTRAVQMNLTIQVTTPAVLWEGKLYSTTLSQKPALWTSSLILCNYEAATVLGKCGISLHEERILHQKSQNVHVQPFLWPQLSSQDHWEVP